MNLDDVEFGGLEVPVSAANLGSFLTRAIHPKFGPGWLLFDNPQTAFESLNRDSIQPMLRQIEAHIESGGCAAGWLTYESGGAFDEAIANTQPDGYLAVFALYPELPKFYRVLPATRFELPQWIAGWSQDEYRFRFDEVKTQIEAGVTYQVNLAFPMNATLADNWGHFCALCGTDPPVYATFMNHEGCSVASFSPELFFERNGPSLVSRPMKGTRPRDPNPTADEALRAELQMSEKDRAENLMIVDMVRNDLGRVAEPGTVQVTRLFDVAAHRTVWQMTSSVECETKSGLTEIFAALFPCASVTGTPKIMATETILRLEKKARGVYTGSLGFGLPNERWRMSVPIRTVQVKAEQAIYHVGSGIVADSTAAAEWAECLVKVGALQSAPEPFQLLETMLVEPGSGIFLKHRHIQRMKASAIALGFRFDLAEVERLLHIYENWSESSRVRLRLLLTRDGHFNLQPSPFVATESTLKAALDCQPMASLDPIAAHKTTARDHLLEAQLRNPGFEEVLMHDHKGSICGFLKGNLVAEVNGKRVTPQFQPHFLAGTFTQHLLETGEVELVNLTVSEIGSFGQVWRVNSVSKWVKVQIAQ